jgi:DNA-binding IclR family transcriptional regulator
VEALARGLKVLQCFASGEERLGNQDLAERCGLPKSTVTWLTYTLTKLGFLHHVAEEGRYRLGMATLTLGGTTLSRLDAKEVSRPRMQYLINATECLIALGLRDGMSMLYMETCCGDSIVTLRLPGAARAVGWKSASARSTLRAGRASRRASGRRSTTWRSTGAAARSATGAARCTPLRRRCGSARACRSRC